MRSVRKLMKQINNMKNKRLLHDSITTFIEFNDRKILKPNFPCQWTMLLSLADMINILRISCCSAFHTVTSTSKISGLSESILPKLKSFSIYKYKFSSQNMQYCGKENCLKENLLVNKLSQSSICLFLQRKQDRGLVNLEVYLLQQCSLTMESAN